MTMPRLIYGLTKLPDTLAVDDPRLPAVALGAQPSRLNTLPLPPEAWDGGEADHTARVAAVRAWLLAGCGDYDVAARRAVTRYLDAVAAHLTEHRAELEAGLARFHGLYQPEDWFWSALRPLPRAWWPCDGAWRHAELAFWDGAAVIAMRAADLLADPLPAPCRRFWDGETLPVSPFRRPLPAGSVPLAPVDA